MSGRSLRAIIANVNRTLRGWFEYFKHYKVATVLLDLDGRPRRRLRRILPKREKRHWRQGRGAPIRNGPARSLRVTTGCMA